MADKGAGLRGGFYPTAIGSLPYRDAGVACGKILENFSQIPFWPQLVKRSFFENMYVQFSEGLPGAVVDAKEKTIYVDTRKGLSKDIEVLYERFLGDDVDFFSISSDYAEGLYRLIELVGRTGARPIVLKGQITGPVSFGLTVTDEKRRPLFYNPELKEALLKALVMKARWQIRKLKAAGTEVAIFIDEPYLASIGSSFISLKRQDALSALNDMVEAIHREGAVCGIHCCGNTDWGFILGADIDILSFDAYNFHQSISLYPKEVGDFLGKGGLLAWGIVPNTQEVLKETERSLMEILRRAIGLLVKKGIREEDLLESMLITPSCGLGLIDEYLAQFVIEHTVRLSQALRDGAYGKPGTGAS